MKKLFIGFVASVGLLFGGEITSLENSVKIKKGDKELDAKINDKVDSGDTIITGKDAKVKIKFEDGTTFFIGKDTVFSIDEFLLKEENSSAKFSMSNGVFRFITGKISKLAPQNFQLKTKTATIGIRGTHAGGFVEHNKSDIVYIGEGNGIIIDSKLGKRELTKEGQGVVFEEGKEPSEIKFWKKEKVDKLFSITE